MRFGAHLPLIHLDGSPWRPGELASYTDTARTVGFDLISVNDHLVFNTPWLDGIVALASVVDRSAGMSLATTIALPVVRGPAAVAKAAAALDILSGGRLVLGVGPGSSERDYRIAGVNFEERWPRFDATVRVLRSYLKPGPPGDSDQTRLEPLPVQAGGPPVWIGSWGSDAGLHRVARLGDGWLASAYNLHPSQAAAARAKLGQALARQNRSLDGFPCALATMWTYVTQDGGTAQAQLAALANMLNRPATTLREQVLIGPAERCAAILREYAQAGIDTVFVWPLADGEKQLERVMQDVVPLM